MTTNRKREPTASGVEVRTVSGRIRFSGGGFACGEGVPDVVIAGRSTGVPETLRPTAIAQGRVVPRMTPAGKATAETWTWNDERGYVISWTVSRLESRDGFTLQMAFRNVSGQPVVLREFGLLRTGDNALRVEGAGGDWWLSCLDSHDAARGGFNPSGDLATEASRSFLDTLTLSRRGGGGLLIAAVGPPESDVRMSGRVANGAMSLSVAAETNDIVVESGETRRTDEVLFHGGAYDAAVRVMADWLAATHGSRTERGPLSGWCSWYDREARITASYVLEVLNAVSARRDRLPLEVFQIDDGWQREYGLWEADPEKFPEGMKAVADRIKDEGLIPGIWMCPNRYRVPGAHPDGVNTGEWLDPSHPKTQDFIREAIGKRVQEGFRYFKFDFNWIRAPKRHDGKMTRLQIYRALFRLYRESIGDGAYMLACVGGPTRGPLGFADAARIGTDSTPKWGAHYAGCCIADCIDAVGAAAPVNGVWYANDPDVAYLAPFGGLNADEVRTWQGFVGLLGGMALTSTPFDNPEYLRDAVLRSLEVMLPPAPDKACAWDGGTDWWHRQFGFVARRSFGKFAAVLLWNPETEPADVPLASAVLEALGKRFHAWSFWDGVYLGIVDETYVAKALPQHASQVLRLTAMAGDPAAPLLVGSDLHLSMGAAELRNVESDGSGMTIVLNGDAGARSGRLFIHSPRKLALAKAERCAARVAGGEGGIHVVTVSERKRGEENTIVLAVP